MIVMRTSKEQLKESIIILGSALICVFAFWVLFSVAILIDPSYGYYHSEVLK